MSPQDIRNLLGGYATGTLTEAEQHALYAAALEDEKLFAALADEQALKELLDDPAARGQLLASLEKRPSWIWTLLRRPSSLAVIGTAAVVAAVVGVTTMRPTHDRYVDVARVSPPTVATPATMASAPPPAQLNEAAPKPRRARQPAALTAERPADLSRTAAAASNPNLTLRYGLLKQGSTGAYVPADIDRLLGDDDLLRVQVESSDAGTLRITQGTSVVYTGSIASHVPTTIPQEGALTPKGGSLRVVFNRLTVPLANTMMRAKSDTAVSAGDQISVDIKLR